MMENLHRRKQIVFVTADGEVQSGGSAGLAEAGGRCCGNVAEERHEPGDGGAGERTLEQPQHP